MIDTPPGIGLVASQSVALLTSLLDQLAPLWAEAQFPRGPGFYYHPVKLIVVVLIYFAWARMVWWLDLDARNLGYPVATFNLAGLGVGLLGALVVWLSPFFVVTIALLQLLFLTPLLTYVYYRNQKVPPAARVLTPNHLRELGHRWFKLPLDEERSEGGHLPIRFIAKTKGDEEDDTRVRRLQASPGYRAGLELVYKAVQMRTTDIHMEPTREEMTVRYRVDGILQPAAPIDRDIGEAVINIFKVLANLDITEKRKPQDGSFSAEIATPNTSAKRARAAQRRKARAGNGKARRADRDDVPVPVSDDEITGSSTASAVRQVDFRVATAGSVAGEKLVLRILDRTRQVSSLTQLGMRERLREQLRSIVGQPHGMFIVCGPTGAGKSTTLYACLTEIDRFQKNVITLENPVEYHIENVTQIEVNPKAGKTFASELRSILRQDPDLIYIGEIRDQETAEIACQAAQTGHMVFTTLHANDTVMALGRLLDLGVQPFMVASAVSAILGQRLVRVLCPKCKQRYRPSADALRKINLNPEKVTELYRPLEIPLTEDEGVDRCKNCGGTGYHGRTGVFEMLVMNDGIRELIRESPNLNAIRQEAVKSGMKYLQEDGLRQVIEGDTSIQELLRVCK